MARPDPEKEDLEEAGQKIITNIMKQNPEFQGNVAAKNKKIASFISEAYKQFRKLQIQNFVHRNFHTLRDFYWTFKIFAELWLESGHKKANFGELIGASIDTNFSGLYRKNAVIKKLENGTLTIKDANRNKRSSFELTSNYTMKNYLLKLSKKWSEMKIDLKSLMVNSDSCVLDYIENSLLKEKRRYLMLFVDQSLTERLLVDFVKG